MERPMNQKLLAEFVGAFALIFLGAGAVIHTAGSNLIAMAFASGLAIAVMVSAVGHVSGAHFNPAVTIGAWVTQKIDSKNALAYIVSQLAGAVAAAGLLRVSIPELIWKGQSVSGGPSVVNLGTPAVATQISTGQGVLIEAILTFFLVWVIFATAIDPEGSFGKIAEYRPILQKGDNFTVPEKGSKRQRYVAEYLIAKTGRPHVNFVREKVNEPEP